MSETLFDQPTAPPPLKRKPVPALVRLEAEDDFTGIILSDKIHWVGCHWDGKRSLPHFKDDPTCQGCERELPKHFKGFLFIQFSHEEKPCFLEISELAARNFNLQGPVTNTARGCKVRCKRERRTKKSPVCVTHIGNTSSLSALPKDQEPIRTMCRIWRCEDKLDAFLAKQQKV